MTKDDDDGDNWFAQLSANAGSVEPSAVNREWAITLYGMFLALIDVGFTEIQALTIVGQTINAAIQNNNN